MSAVKLRDFFENQWNKALWADHKAEILSSIKSKINPTTVHNHYSSRYTRYSKVLTSALVVFVISSLFYSPNTLRLQYTPFGALLSSYGPNIAQAWYIGTVLNTQGSISIVRNGETLSTDQLKWWDTLYLYNTSKAEVLLRNGSRSTIEWPAQITILEQDEQWLLLSVQHARYIEINQLSGDSLNILADNDLQLIKEPFTIVTNTSRITALSDQNLHLALITTQDRQLLQNKWDAVSIESLDQSGINSSKQLAHAHVADLTSATKIYSEISTIYQELKQQSAGQTYNFSDQELDTEWIRALLVLETNKTTTANAATSIPKTNTTTRPTNTTTTTTEYNEPALLAVATTTESWNTLDEVTIDPQSTTPSDNVATIMAANIDLSRNEKEQIWSALGIQNNRIAWNNNSNTTTKEPILQPLSITQLNILYWLSGCIDDQTRITLQEWFMVGPIENLTEFSRYIIQNYHLDTTLRQVVLTLYQCSDINPITNDQ